VGGPYPRASTFNDFACLLTVVHDLADIIISTRQRVAWRHCESILLRLWHTSKLSEKLTRMFSPWQFWFSN